MSAPSPAPRPGVAFAVFALGSLAVAVNLQTVLSDTNSGNPPQRAWNHLASSMMSRAMWGDIVQSLGADRPAVTRGEFVAPFLPIAFWIFGVAASGLLLGGGLAVLATRSPWRSVLAQWAVRGWAWWCLIGVWEVTYLSASLAGWSSLVEFLRATLPLWYAVALGGWLAALLAIDVRTAVENKSPELAKSGQRLGALVTTTMFVVSVATFVWMNWQLYFGLHVPHGDSAMYEEHLWNLTHGKGFRSYLDDGRLFLGEHVQVVHVLLLPVYWFWPSHLLLELSESLALASGAFPVYWIARRHGGSTRAAVLLAAAYLLYTPLHFLDIAVDLKTFRPTSFGVPAVLFALDQLDRRRYITMLVLLLIALSAKEDYAVIVSCVGVWMAFAGRRADESPDQRRRRIAWGTGLAIFGAVYLLVVIRFVIPAFRGDVPHYARYFGELGNTPGDVAASFFKQPGLIAAKLFSRRSFLYALLLLVPIGGLPLRSLSRLAVALPWFGVLCLLEFSADPANQGTEMLLPGHHFHAPLVPVLFWAAASGIGSPLIPRFRNHKQPGSADDDTRRPPCPAAAFAFGCALFSGLFLSFTPLSLGFWDSGSQLSWRKRYIPDERAEKVKIVEALIPDDARVFSTDFVHTRLTHRRRSYDYSAYKRKSDIELVEPVTGEDYYIVIDLKSRYNLDKPPGERIESPKDVPAYVANPEAWKVIPHDASEYFLVLRRR